MSTSTVAEMKVTREQLNRCTVKLDIVCSSDQVDAGFRRAVRELGKTVRVPGFRPGKAPAKVVEQAIDPNRLYQAAAEFIVKSSMDEAIKNEELEPANVPSIELNKLERDSSECEYIAKIPLAPVVELKGLDKLSANMPEVKVTDEEVEKQIEELRRSQGKKQEVTDRGIQTGDVAVVNLKADGEEGDGRTFMVVAGQTFEGLDKALTGMSVEDTKALKLDFPENFQDPNWAGQKKKAVTVLVKSISAVQMPDLDDEFAKSYNLDDVATLKDRVRNGIEHAKTVSAEEMVREQLLDQVLSASTVEVADTTWEQVVQQRLQEIQQQIAQQRKSLEDYAKDNGMTFDAFKSGLEEEAKVNVRRAVVIDRIFRDEKMEISPDDVNKHLVQIAMENRIPQNQFEEFIKQYGPQLREEVQYRSMAAKVTDWLMEKANVGKGDAAPKKTTSSKAKADDSEKPKKAPAKKAPAKGTKKKDS
ncbi:MAG: trigger factor [Armatimonadetes bacterium]|nr:trigger factor [Armatimonadota bacterium]